MSISREDAPHSSPTVYNRFIERGSHKGKGLAVFTSGGDSQGMSVNLIFMTSCVTAKSEIFPFKIL
jgi:hypothetical protein